jgi:hypothetical protein
MVSRSRSTLLDPAGQSFGPRGQWTMKNLTSSHWVIFSVYFAACSVSCKAPTQSIANAHGGDAKPANVSAHEPPSAAQVDSEPQPTSEPSAEAVATPPAIAPSSAAAPFDPVKARQLADVLARLHIAEIQAAHRATDPRVQMALGDYKVTQTELKSDDGDQLDISYEFVKAHPGFPIWLGDGMEFDVFIRKRDGQATLVGGE